MSDPYETEEIVRDSYNSQHSCNAIKKLHALEIKARNMNLIYMKKVKL